MMSRTIYPTTVYINLGGLLHVIVMLMSQMLAHRVTPLSEPKVRCTAHGLSFTRLRYMHNQFCVLFNSAK